MSGWTNKWKARVFRHIFLGEALPAHYYVALITSDTIPTSDTNLLGDLTEIPAGNGYTSGGFQLTPGATDFDLVVEDDDANLARVQIKDVEWNAVGGPIPATGTAAYAVLTDDNAVVASREVLQFWSLGGERVVQNGYPIQLVNFEIRITE